MRLEINVPDSTPTEVKDKLVRLAVRLNAHPELVDELVGSGPDVIPDYLTIMDGALLSPNRLKSAEEVEDYINNLRSEW